MYKGCQIITHWLCLHNVIKLTRQEARTARLLKCDIQLVMILIKIFTKSQGVIFIWNKKVCWFLRYNFALYRFFAVLEIFFNPDQSHLKGLLGDLKIKQNYLQSVMVMARHSKLVHKINFVWARQAKAKLLKLGP